MESSRNPEDTVMDHTTPNAGRLRPTRLCALIHRAAILGACLGILTPVPQSGTAAAATFTYENISDRPGGPGGGNHPSINDEGDIAFQDGLRAYFYDRSAGTVTDLLSLPGAPTEGWNPKLNRAGNILMVHTSTREPWFYRAATQSFVNLATLPGFPGVSEAHDVSSSFDLNNYDNASLHVGDLNFGDVWYYNGQSQSFTNITDLPGGTGRGRENRINDMGQIAYHGFPDAYVFDPVTGVHTNITDLPGGPGSSFGSFSFNVAGDVVVFRSDEITYYDATDQSFLYLSTLAGFPIHNASTNVNDVSSRGSLSFWLGEIYYFDPLAQDFTQLTNQGAVPFPGLASSINSRDEIAFVAGGDIWLATPVNPTAAPAPRSAVLLENRPNPFNPSTQLRLKVVGKSRTLDLRVYDARGRMVRAFGLLDLEPGVHAVNWDGRDDAGRELPSGVYYSRASDAEVIVTGKMSLIR